MTIELVKILEAALEYLKEASSWFDYYELTNDEDDFRISVQWSKRAKGLLDAYEILTGRHIACIAYRIREELETQA